ncbi:CapA family protein [Anaerocolumna sp.]|uniref:CapA family protein n=1 Tax=Anaerocolumna sp. TaxID=2041569 RepID=UPI0028AC2D0C|nr:CapA family protein [Anaerocolumna sp.]
MDIKKMRIRRIKGIFTLSLVVSSLLFLQGCNPSKEKISVSVSDTNLTSTMTGQIPPVPIIYTKEETPEKEENNTKQELTLLAVGDNLIHMQIVKSGLKKDGSYNYDHLYSTLKPDIEAADIAIINQETILGGNEFPYSGYPVFNSPTEIGDALIHAGFDVVLHASNHALDKGYPGIKNTLEYWNKHPLITVLGINKSQEDKDTIQIIEKNGIKIAMLNYTYGLNGFTMPKDKPFLVNMLDKSEMKKDIKKAKKLADFVIVFPHWGTEYVYQPNDTQKDLASFFAEEGVDLVIGTHPHVLQPVTWIVSDSGHPMLIYYSLGNFVSYQREAPRMLGGMAHITITKEKEITYISKAGITPIVTHYESARDSSYTVYKLEDYTVDKAIRHGILKLQKESSFSLSGTRSLAKQILGDWHQLYPCPVK